MSSFAARHALPLLLLLATASACGGERDPVAASDPDPSTSTSAALEEITAQGVAGVVRDVLGAELIVSYSAAGESDSVGLLARLAGRQLLVVNVQVEGDAPIQSCDDNTRGSTVLAQSVNPETGRVVYALYETYSRPAGLDAATLTAIVSDPALDAMTDPAVNEAGADIELTGGSK